MEAETIIKELGCLPLAIEQAGAYIWAQGSALNQYLVKYKTNFQRVTESRPEGLERYATVYTTWQTSLEAIKAKNIQSAELLFLYSFLSNNVADDIILHGEEKVAEVDRAEQLQTSIEFLLSYSLVKRDGSRYKVWIHPVVHEWVHQHLTSVEKVQYTEHAMRIVAKCIEWNSENQDSEKKLMFVTSIWPDVDACLKNMAKYLQNGTKLNLKSWACFRVIRDFLQEQGMFKQGIILGRTMKDEFEKYHGIDHPDTLSSINDLALLYSNQGKYAEAEPLYKEALAGRQKALGQEHPDTLSSINDLALLYYVQGKYSEAEPLYKEALAGRQKALGQEHPHTLSSINNLALLYNNQGKYSEAGPLYNEELAGYQNTFGQEHVENI